MNQDDSAILTIDQFAKKLRISRPSVIKMIETGRILAFRLGDEYKSHFRIRESEINRLISWELEKKNNPTLNLPSSCKNISRLHGIWLGMIARCENPNMKAYKYYGEKGIKVCERWKTFQYFLDDMGCSPKPWSVDRLNNDLGYFLENCVWSTPEGQIKNKKRPLRIFEYEGKKITLLEFAKLKNIKYNTLIGRLRRGFPLEDVFNENLFIKGRKRKIDRERKKIS